MPHILHRFYVTLSVVRIPIYMHTYLALGDSYTIGTSIDVVDGYPNQTFQLLKGAGLKMSSLQIIAKNGWTADDLKNGLANADKKSAYQIVTILIGVNNQYQGKSMSEYEPAFLSLLKYSVIRLNSVDKSV